MQTALMYFQNYFRPFLDIEYSCVHDQIYCHCCCYDAYADVAAIPIDVDASAVCQFGSGCQIFENLVEK